MPEPIPTELRSATLDWKDLLLWNGRPIHLGLVGGGLGAMIVASALTAARYPRSNMPEARALRQKE